METKLPEFPDFPPGEVWLAGAGPGDPGLLTLHALHALRTADDIVHDALVDPRILGLAGQQARLSEPLGVTHLQRTLHRPTQY